MCKSNITVSVCVVTYNQKEYIGECLESLVTQQTNFSFEILVGDDASTDGTDQIIQKYYDKYPNIIVPIFRQNNIGAVRNIIDIYKKASGQYIAHLDGDDLALPGKLQAQFDALEENLDCSMCAHNVWIWDRHLTDFDFNSKKTGIYTLLDLYLDLPFFAHSSKMFRNDLLDKYWDDFTDEALDIAIHIEQAKKGEIYYLQEQYGIYRRFVGVSESSTYLNPIVMQEVVRVYDEALANNYGEVVKKAFAYKCLEFAQRGIAINEQKIFQQYIRKSYCTMYISRKQKFLYYISYVPCFSVEILKKIIFFKNIFKK